MLLGTGAARLVGLPRGAAPAGETLGVGLASGLLVLAAWWAALASGGRSSFTPVAAGFAIAIVLAIVRRARTADPAEPASFSAFAVADETLPSPSTSRRNLALAVLGGALFVVIVALVYGSTLTLSPRDEVQPVDFNDTAYYGSPGRRRAARSCSGCSRMSSWRPFR